MSETKVEQPKEINAKDIEIVHKEKGKIKLGDLSKNESCRVIKELLERTNQIQMLNNYQGLVLQELKVKDLNEAKAIVENKIKEAQKDAGKDVPAK